ncbi:TetR/AcrR family transcriptional regulator [Xanthobacter autotrophicus]|uniref:TetR/AcrR family transcriptional regulator n=1 Tax=Xanthobacter TaxID=279 RepID=UPI0024AA69E6|nr:TetR/AcrR family transcriptional regulator [Xanthobacter autotrophicus]MDI4665369.1 TetR/AcrR family transcriptional regulator [Xanthobacter autotrophicus]
MARPSGRQPDIPAQVSRRAAGVEPRRRRAPAMDKAERRRAILAAALTVFSDHGFAGARLDDVARHAGVAKGTLYLHFADKEALFRGLVEQDIAPVLADADAVVGLFPGSTRDLIDRLIVLITQRVMGTPAEALVRLMIAEGPRFPELAAFYHREVVSRGLAIVRKIAQRGLDRGEITSDLAVRFPQLVISPAIVAVIWNGMFGAFDPLDAKAFLAAHRDLLLRGLGWRDM